MKKSLIKVSLPLIAALLSGCSLLSWINDTAGINSATDTNVNKEDNSNNSSSEKTPDIPEPIFPASIELPNSLPLSIGEKATLNVTYSPENSDVKDITWISSDTNIATVKNGEVTGIQEGTVTVSASTKNKEGQKIESECNVVVTDPGLISKTKLKYTYDTFKSHHYYPYDNTPLTGKPKLLVVPIWFNDSTDFIKSENRELVRDDMRITFFGTNEETGWRSVSSYYEEESKGKMVLIGTVTDWYETKTSYATYKSESSGAYNTQNLVSTVVDWYFSDNENESKSDYDVNNDGYLDGVILIYAAPDYASMSQYDGGNLWAYTSWLFTSASKDNPNPNVYFWGSYDFMYSFGKTALARTGLGSYGRGDTRFCNIDSHCFIHEMGHVLGLDDYYDYSGQHSPAGGFSMQDMNVGGHDAYSVMAYGWAEPYIPKESMTIKLNDFQSSHDTILLANHDVNSPFDEYVLLELFTPTGLNSFDCENSYRSSYPQGSSEVGIRLWHVDARLYSYKKDKFTSNPNDGKIVHAVENTYYKEGSGSNAYLTSLGDEYYDYNILQLLRCNGDYEDFDSEALFGLNSEFSMENNSWQFVNEGLLNDKSVLGWEFKVVALNEASAAIEVTKVV